MLGKEQKPTLGAVMPAWLPATNHTWGRGARSVIPAASALLLLTQTALSQRFFCVVCSYPYASIRFALNLLNCHQMALYINRAILPSHE